MDIIKNSIHFDTVIESKIMFKSDEPNNVFTYFTFTSSSVGNNMYVENMTTYFNVVYNTISTSSVITDLTFISALSPFFNTKLKLSIRESTTLSFERNEFKYTSFILPIIASKQQILNSRDVEIVFYNKAWLDYQHSSSPSPPPSPPLNHKWQIFFNYNDYIYKFYVFFKLITLFNTLSSHNIIEMKTDIAPFPSLSRFNLNLIIIYVNGDDIIPSSTTTSTLTTREVYDALSRINLDFTNLRINKILFRNGDISKERWNPSYTQQDIKSMFAKYNIPFTESNEHTPNFKNFLRLKSLYDAEMDERGNVSISKTFYTQHTGEILTGGVEYDSWNSINLFTLLLIVASLLIIIIVVILLQLARSGDGDNVNVG